MNRVEDFSAELASPALFRDICALLASVGRVCTLATRPADADAGEELLLFATNAARTLQMWVHLSAAAMFHDFRLPRPEWLEVKADSLAHVFRNEAGLATMSEVRMRVSHKQARQHSTHASAGSQVVPPAARLVSFTMDNKRAEALATKAVEQRIYAECVAADDTLVEPVLAGLRIWADPKIPQMHQMAKVCDQYKQMNERVRVTVAQEGLLTLVSEAPDAVATTSWRIDFAQRADEESLFVDEDGAAAAPAARDGPPRDHEACTVLARDWSLVLQCRRMCRRVIVGVLHDSGIVVYGFLKHSGASAQDVVTFYLWHQG